MLGKKRKDSKSSKNDESNKRKSSKVVVESDSESESQVHVKNGKKTNGKSKELKLSSDKADKEEVKVKSNFNKYPLSEEIIGKLKEKNITSLFEVQEKVFEPVFSGENVVVASLTGSGKTLSFILPIIEKCIQGEKFNHKLPTVIVVAPTRELAIQIGGEFSSLSSKNTRDKNYYKVAMVYGGTVLDDTKDALRKGCDIVVGTPGRILDMISRQELILEKIRFGVLDEADKMLEMGFKEPIEEIFQNIYNVSQKVQVCLFSATIHKWVIETAKSIMPGKDPKFINLVQNLQGRCPVGVKHLTVNCLRNERISTIADLSNFFKSSSTLRGKTKKYNCFCCY